MSRWLTRIAAFVLRIAPDDVAAVHQFRELGFRLPMTPAQFRALRTIVQRTRWRPIAGEGNAPLGMRCMVWWFGTQSIAHRSTDFPGGESFYVDDSTGAALAGVTHWAELIEGPQ